MPSEPINFQNGAAIDTRPENEKLKDFKFQEIVAAATPVDWVEKVGTKWRSFEDQEQDGSGSCVAQTIKKLAGILLWLKEGVYVKFSATHIYQRRSNKPDTGMIGVEAFELWKNGGITLEDLAKSENMNDATMDAEVIEQYKQDVGAVFKIGGHVGIDNADFETVASVIQKTGKGVMVWFYFNSEEWSPTFPSVQDPNLQLSAPATLRHSVAAVDYGLIGGKKYLLIEDSAHFGGSTRRFISEDFFKARNWFSRYPMSFTFQPDQTPAPTPKPHYTFSTILEFGMTSPAVKALQDILKYEGLFPTNIDSSGYYGAITAKAVLAWQKKHAVASTEELDSLQGRRVGIKTIAALNQLYG